METVLIVILICLLLIAAVLVVVMLRRKQREGGAYYAKNKNYVIVKNGVDVDNQKIGSEMGAYFENGVDVTMTCMISQTNTSRWQLSFTDKDTNRQSIVNFTSSMIVGRIQQYGGTPQLVLGSDSMVSKTHCMLYVYNGQLYIRDMNSKNATYLNGRRVEADTPVNQGDVLQVGRTRLTIGYGAGI